MLLGGLFGFHGTASAPHALVQIIDVCFLLDGGAEGAPRPWERNRRGSAPAPALSGDGSDLRQLKRLVVEKTGGNPFFMEEMVQSLFEQRVLERKDGVNLMQPLTELKIPPTVQGILASRIDRLPAEEKELLQILAVIGTEFPLTLIKRLIHPMQPGTESTRPAHAA